MKGFEQAFEILKGFQFEDKGSELNALWLHHWINKSRALAGSFRPPMVVIIGPMGSGIHRLISSACKNVPFGCVIPVDGFKSADLDFAARKRATVLLHEKCSRLVSKALGRFITAEMWSAKEFNSCTRRQSVMSFNLNTVVIVTGEPGLVISPDLQRRSVFIRLK